MSKQYKLCYVDDNILYFTDDAGYYISRVHKNEEGDHGNAESLGIQLQFATKQDVVDDMESVQRRERDQVEYAHTEIAQRKLVQETLNMDQPACIQPFGYFDAVIVTAPDLCD